MPTSRDRILTTHVGSLPRSFRAVECLKTREAGQHCDQAEFDAAMREGVDEVVARQLAVGIDIVSDGETSKIGYATYIRHRLSGFELGDVPRATPADLDAYPSFRDRLAKAGATAKYKRPICRSAITYENREPLERDLAHLRAAVDAADVTGAFMNAPSPGVIALFQPNEFYDTLDEYLDALADAMKVEYEGIVAAAASEYGEKTATFLAARCRKAVKSAPAAVWNGTAALPSASLVSRVQSGPLSRQLIMHPYAIAWTRESLSASRASGKPAAMVATRCASVSPRRTTFVAWSETPAGKHGDNSGSATVLFAGTISPSLARHPNMR